MESNKYVGLFFFVNKQFLIRKCIFQEAEKYGDFLNYPESHDSIWQNEYATKYRVDFDYYPRGRIVYSIKDDMFLIYFDKCIANHIKEIVCTLPKEKTKLCYDEHYQCHMCNKQYNF